MLFISSAIIFVFLIFLLEKFKFKLKLLDIPNTRKIHNEPIAITGGIAIFFTIFLLVPFLKIDPLYMFIIYSSSLILILGIYDDLYDLNPKLRLLIHFLIASIVYIVGIKIVDFNNLFYSNSLNTHIFKSLTIFLTFFSIMCVVNAFNFIDGLDGLCVTNGIITVLTIIMLMYINNNFLNNFLLLFLFVLFLFLFFNFGIFGFKVFLGDSGSTSIGYLIALILIYHSMPENRMINPAIVIWCITLPMYDLGRIVVTRFTHNYKLSNPDNNHIHHIFLKNGFSKIKSYYLVTLISFCLNLIGITSYYYYGQNVSAIFFIILFFIYLFTINALNIKKT